MSDIARGGTAGSQIAAVTETKPHMRLWRAAAAIEQGQAACRDTDGTVVLADASAAATADNFIGIALGYTGANEAGTFLYEGSLGGFTISGMDYGDVAYLSDTAGALSTTPGTREVPVGVVLPLSDKDKTKVLYITADLVAGNAANGVGSRFVIPSQLLAASVDNFVAVLPVPARLIAVYEIHEIVGGSSAAVRPRKITADAVSAGAAAGATVKELTAADIDLTATARTLQTPALTATTADLDFAAGDRLAENFTGTLTGLVGRMTYLFEMI